MSLMFLLLFIILHANFSDGDEPYDKAIKIRTKRAEGTTQVTLITPALNTNVEVQKVEEKNYQKRFEREVNESNDDLEDDKVEYSDEKSIDSDYKGFFSNSAGKSVKRQRPEERKGPKLWDHWGKWSLCSVSCGIGKITRWRHCVSGGCASGEKEAQIKTCTLPAC